MNNLVSLKYLDDYRLSAVNNVVKSCFADLNISRILKPRAKVLLKVNIPGPYAPDQAKTTHPDIVRGIVDALTEINVSVTVIDSPYGKFSQAELDNVYLETGMLGMANKTKCALNHNLHTYTQEIPNGNKLKFVELLEEVKNADYIINVGKINVDDRFGYLGAVNNIFGFVPGDRKLQIINRLPDIDSYNEALLDIYSILKDKIVLNIVDGVVGLQANHVQKMLSFIAMSEDIFSIDAACQDIIGFDFKKSILSIAEEKGYFNSNKPYKTIGENIDRFKTSSFVTNMDNISLHKDSTSQQKLMKKYQTRVSIPENRCKGCSVCSKICPVGAINMKYDKNGDLFASVDMKKCIFCNKCVISCPYSVIQLKQPAKDIKITKQIHKQKIK
ncbi:MAG: DUF362 domain-containing protein [Clostridia bacterium]|nr:DUF362 domain-containing protein [Clostridia bacterium]